MNDHRTATAQGVDLRHVAVDVGDDRLPLGLARFEEFDHAQQPGDLLLHHLHHLLDLFDAFALGDFLPELYATAVHVVQNLLQGADTLLLHVGDAGQILTRDTTGMEGAHRQLRARFTDGLRGDDSHRLAGFDESPRRQVAAIAHGTDALTQLAGEGGADGHFARRQPAQAAQAPAEFDQRLLLRIRGAFAFGDNDLPGERVHDGFQRGHVTQAHFARQVAELIDLRHHVADRHQRGDEVGAVVARAAILADRHFHQHRAAVRAHFVGDGFLDLERPGIRLGFLVDDFFFFLVLVLFFEQRRHRVVRREVGEEGGRVDLRGDFRLRRFAYLRRLPFGQRLRLGDGHRLVVRLRGETRQEVGVGDDVLVEEFVGEAGQLLAAETQQRLARFTLRQLGGHFLGQRGRRQAMLRGMVFRFGDGRVALRAMPGRYHDPFARHAGGQGAVADFMVTAQNHLPGNRVNDVLRGDAPVDAALQRLDLFVAVADRANLDAGVGAAVVFAYDHVL